MKILHFVDYFSPNTHTFIYDYIIELDNHKINNYVLTLNWVNRENRPYKNVIEVKIKRDFFWLILRSLALLNRKPSKKYTILRRELRAIVKKLKPEIIHAQFGNNGVLIAPIAKEFNIPLVVTFHGYDVSILTKKPFWIQNYKKLFQTGQLFIGVSNHICNKIKNLGCNENKIIRFAAGIKIENFKFRETVIDVDQEIKLIHIGRLIEKKSPLLLIKAFKLVSDYYENKLKLSLTIIGDGPLQDDTMKLIKQLNLNEKVKMLGAVKHDEIMNLLYESHIYTQHCVTAQNGDQEGLGISFLEASATGLPIVTTNHNGIPDAVINYKTGFLVPEGDYQTMAKKIIELIENPDLAKKFGIQGRKHVENNFDINKQILIALNYYKNLVR